MFSGLWLHRGSLYLHQVKCKISKKTTYRESVPTDNRGECASHVLPKLREVIRTSSSMWVILCCCMLVLNLLPLHFLYFGKSEGQCPIVSLQGIEGVKEILEEEAIEKHDFIPNSCKQIGICCSQQEAMFQVFTILTQGVFSYSSGNWNFVVDVKYDISRFW